MVAALNGSDHALQVWVPTVVFLGLWVWGVIGHQRHAASREWYGVLAVTSLITAVLTPIGLALGPITVMALGLLVLAARGRDFWLGLTGVALLMAPIDVRGAIALFGGVETSRVGLQVIAASALLAAGVWARRRESRSAPSTGPAPVATC